MRAQHITVQASKFVRKKYSEGKGLMMTCVMIPIGRVGMVTFGRLNLFDSYASLGTMYEFQYHRG